MKDLEFLTKPLKRTFDFNGRASRQEFWLYFLCLFAAAVAAVFVIMGVTIGVCTELYGPSAQQGCGWIGVFICMLFLPIVFPVLLMSAGARRLHDTNKSGWWQLLALIPYLGIAVLAVLMALPGTEGENRFGPQPKA